MTSANHTLLRARGQAGFTLMEILVTIAYFFLVRLVFFEYK